MLAYPTHLLEPNGGRLSLEDLDRHKYRNILAAQREFDNFPEQWQSL